jgi:predicted acetyltransferase
MAEEIQYLDIIKLGGWVRCAYPDYRNLGIASKMMKETMKQLCNVGASVALLCTNTNSFLVEFYRKYGFELLGRAYKFVGKSGKEYVDEEGMLAPINSEEIYTKIMKSKDILDIGVGNW